MHKKKDLRKGAQFNCSPIQLTTRCLQTTKRRSEEAQPQGAVLRQRTSRRNLHFRLRCKRRRADRRPDLNVTSNLMPIVRLALITSGFTGHEPKTNHFTPARMSAPCATLCYTASGQSPFVTANKQHSAPMASTGTTIAAARVLENPCLMVSRNAKVIAIGTHSSIKIGPTQESG